MDTGKTRSTHVTKSSRVVTAGLVEYRVMFASLRAVCSVLVDLLVPLQQTGENILVMKPFVAAAGMRTELLIWR